MDKLTFVITPRDSQTYWLVIMYGGRVRTAFQQALSWNQVSEEIERAKRLD
jgi:hypothetical protein